MKVLLNTAVTDAASTQLNVAKLERLNELSGVSIDFFQDNYQDYDVVLFMGYDHKIEEAKRVNPKIKVGVIDPRPPSKNQPLDADFIIANGMELQDWCFQYCSNVFNYYIYPVLPHKIRHHEKSETIKLGYHGNMIHLEAMQPRISDAIVELHKEIPVEFVAMYNIEELGEWNDEALTNHGVTVKHIQWSDDNYEKYIAETDIGIIPNLMPIDNSDEIKRDMQSNHTIYNEHVTDYLFRFKASSNAGRIFVFAQFGIPVIADMFPSAISIVDHEKNGYIAYSTGSWLHSLQNLALDLSLRKQMGKALSEKFNEDYSPEVQNKHLVAFLNQLLN